MFHEIWLSKPEVYQEPAVLIGSRIPMKARGRKERKSKTDPFMLLTLIIKITA